MKLKKEMTMIADLSVTLSSFKLKVWWLERELNFYATKGISGEKCIEKLFYWIYTDSELQQMGINFNSYFFVHYEKIYIYLQFLKYAH